MAITHVKYFTKSRVEASGADRNGVQGNKISVFGEVKIAYETGGVTVTAADFGLDSLDAVFLTLREVSDAVPAVATDSVNYDYTNSQIQVEDGGSEEGNGHNDIVLFHAIGTSNTPELV